MMNCYCCCCCCCCLHRCFDYDICCKIMHQHGKCDGGGVEGTAAMDVDEVAEAPMVGTISLELEGMV
jgi:hypothetical protein